MNDRSERRDDKIERLRTEVADLRRRILRLEGNRPPSGYRFGYAPVVARRGAWTPISAISD